MACGILVLIANLLVPPQALAQSGDTPRLGAVHVVTDPSLGGVMTLEAFLRGASPWGDMCPGVEPCNLSQLMDGHLSFYMPRLVIYEIRPPEQAAGGSLGQDRALMFMEGFDLNIADVGGAPRDDEGEEAYAFDLLRGTLTGSVGNGGRRPLEELVVEQGYTVYFVDIVDPGFHVGRNATYLERYLQDSTHGGAAISRRTGSELAFMGWSMGGLVGRLALARIDDRGQESNVDLYISYDAPHQGAFLPLSLEVFVRHLSRTLNSGWLYTEVGPEQGRREVRGARDIYDEPSARELLGLYSGSYSHDGWSARQLAIQDDPFNNAAHPSFYDLRERLSEIGDYPSSARLVAVSLGNPNGVIEPDVDVSGTLFKSTFDSTRLVHAHKAYVRASGSNPFLSLDTSGFSSTSHRYLGWPARFRRIDSAPGSSVELLGPLVANLRSSRGDIESYDNEDRVTFIPTLSAIDVRAADHLAPAASLEYASPFDAIYYPRNGNLPHNAMSDDIFRNLVAELELASASAPPPTPAAGSAGSTSTRNAALLMAIF